MNHQLIKSFASVQSGGFRPSLSIALLLEANHYPGLDRLVRSSSISQHLRHHPNKHLTLSTLMVPVEDLLKKIKPFAKAINYQPSQKSRLTRPQLDLLVDLLNCYLTRLTSQFVLQEIKPLIDRHRSIDLEFLGLELWPAGHFVAVFDDQHPVMNQIIHLIREFLIKLFPTGTFRQTKILPHLTLGKYDPEDYRLHHKLRQPSNIPDYRLIQKQWIIYPSVQYRF